MPEVALLEKDQAEAAVCNAPFFRELAGNPRKILAAAAERAPVTPSVRA